MAVSERFYPMGYAISPLRSPGEIRAEMAEIAHRMEGLRERLNVREMLLDSLAGAGDMEAACRQARAAAEEAEAARDEFLALERELGMLSDELEEARDILQNTTF